MSRVCDVTGKRPMAGNNVSHSHRKTRRRFIPNLQTHRYTVDGHTVRLTVSTQGMRLIDLLGIKAVLKKIQEKKKKHG